MAGREEEDESRLYICVECMLHTRDKPIETTVQVINIYCGNAQLEP